MPEETEKRLILTRCEVKIKLQEWAKEKAEDFTTQEAADMVRERAGKIHVNNNKIAQYLRGAAPEFEFHKGMRRWIRKR